MNLNLNLVFSKSMNLNAVFLKSMNSNLKIKHKMNGSNPGNERAGAHLRGIARGKHSTLRRNVAAVASRRQRCVRFWPAQALNLRPPVPNERVAGRPINYNHSMLSITCNDFAIASSWLLFRRLRSGSFRFSVTMSLTLAPKDRNEPESPDKNESSTFCKDMQRNISEKFLFTV